MGQIALQVPQTGQPNSTEDVKIASDFTTLQTVINGNLDHGNLATGAVLELLTTGTTRKVAFGRFSFTGNGTATVSANISHGLGAAPVYLSVAPDGWGFAGACEPLSSDATIIGFTARSLWISGGWVPNGPVTGWTFTNLATYSVWWLAIA